MNLPLLAVGTGSGLSHSIYAAVSKLVLKRRGIHPFLFLLYVNAFQAVITPLVWLFVRPAFPAPAGWPSVLVAGGTCVVAYFLLYLALSTGDVSSVMPMMGSKVVFSGLMAHLLLGEEHTGSIYLAAFLVAVAIGALGYSPAASRPSGGVLKPMLLMLGCCVVFACTDVYIKRSLAYVDPYSFMVYYNALVALGSVLAIPYLRRRNISVRVRAGDLPAMAGAAAFLVGATLMFVVSFRLADGIVVPNILMSSRGVFIVVLSALAGLRTSTALDVQSRWVYVLRFGASLLIIFSIWLALS